MADDGADVPMPEDHRLAGALPRQQPGEDGAGHRLALAEPKHQPDDAGE